MWSNYCVDQVFCPLSEDVQVFWTLNSALLVFYRLKEYMITILYSVRLDGYSIGIIFIIYIILYLVLPNRHLLIIKSA